MTVHAVGTPGRSATKVAISVPFVILAALLCGLGVFTLEYFLITFDLLYLGGGALLVLTGGLMLFHPLAGADRAD